MVKPALRSVSEAEEPRRSLTERLDAEIRNAEQREPTVSSMAARFAPDGLRATKEDPVRAFRDAALSQLAGDPRRKFFPTRGVVAVLTAVAIAPAVLLAGLLWFGALRDHNAFSFTGQRDGRSQQAAIVATPLLKAPRPGPEVTLTLPDTIAATAGEEIGFAIAIDATAPLPARSVIAVRDLPKGAAFSEGRPYGATEWSLRPDEIAGLMLRLPDNETGSKDVRIELVAVDGAVLARAATRLDIAPNATPGLVVRADEADRVGTLIEHGNAMIAVGYLAGARAYFKRAAEAGSGEAALALGATYDPAFIAVIGAHGVQPEPAEARSWYEQAAALGITDQEAQLARLKQAWAHAPEPQPVEADAPDEAAPAAVAPPRKTATKEESGPLGRLVAAAADLTSKDAWVEVTSAVNVRANASGTGEILKVVQAGTKLRSTGQEGSWVEVTDPATSEVGWIYNRFLKETDAP